MRVYPLSDYKLKELKLQELKQRHFQSPHDALYQKNRQYFDRYKPHDIKMEDFLSQKWDSLNSEIKRLYINTYRSSLKELYQAAEQLLIEPKIPYFGVLLFDKTSYLLHPKNKTYISELYNSLSQKEKEECEFQYSKLMEQYEEDHLIWSKRYSQFFSNHTTSPEQVLESYYSQKEKKLEAQNPQLLKMSNQEMRLILKEQHGKQNQDKQKKIEQRQREFISNFLGHSDHLAQFDDQYA